MYFAIKFDETQTKQLVFQTTENGKYCIGWKSDRGPEKGWENFQFDFDTEIKLIKVPKGRIEYFKSILPDEISYKICDEDVQFENGLYLNTDKTELISVFSLEKNLIIPDGITTIKDRAISFRFDSITLPASLKDFSSNMFDSRASIWGDKYLMVKQLFVPLGTKEYFSMRLPQYKDVIWEY